MLSRRFSILQKKTPSTLFESVTKPITETIKAVTETITKSGVSAMTGTTKDTAVVSTPTLVPTEVVKEMTSTDRTVVKTQNWTYSNISHGNEGGTANYSKYYRDDNGNYFVVHRANNLLNSSTGASNVRALWYVDAEGNNKYLTTDGIKDTYYDITSNSTVIFSGTLYTGWTYNTQTSTNTETGETTHACYGFAYGNETATVENQWYYLHSDGEYYPVRRANTLSDGNGNNNVFAAWVVINNIVYYLHGEKLDATGYDTTVTTQYKSIWFKPLYKGGWKYSTIVAASAASDNQTGHYYMTQLETLGKYYPVQKETEVIDGVTTYQSFIIIPNVGKRYLYGTHLSESPCPFSVSNGIFYYFGSLYRGGWTHNNTTDGTTSTKHYYLHSDGEYYPVRKYNETGSFQLYVELPQTEEYPDGKYYFTGNELSSSEYSLSTTKYVTSWFGNFYVLTGWSYADVTDATAGDGHYYKYIDDKYYPVLKEDLGSGSGRYQIYTEVPVNNQIVKRYLWGHSLHSDPCPYSAGTATIIWCGTLYKGGWKYSTITVNSGSNQGYSYLHSNGEYYPIYQKTLDIDGVTTYQDYVILPDGNEWYLCGNEISLNPYQYAKKNTVNNWFGPLYSGAWTSANLSPLSTAANGLFYLYDDIYYPVKKETLTDPTTTYQLYIDTIYGKKYLYGTGLSDSPYPFSSRTNVAIYYGPLYSGGWTYNNLTDGSPTGGQFYYDKGTRKYYMIEKGTHKVGSTTYYHATLGLSLDGYELPGGPWYLTGSEISTSYSTNYEKQAAGATLWFSELYEIKET